MTDTLVFFVLSLLAIGMSSDILFFFVTVGLALVLLTITDKPFFIWLFKVLHSFSDAFVIFPPLA